MNAKFLSLLLLTAVAGYGQRTQALINQRLTKPVIYAYTVATLPTSGGGLTVGAVAVVNDATIAGSCTSGGGSLIALCRWNGSAWASLGGATGGGNVTGPAAGTGGELTTVSADGLTLSRSALTGVLKAAAGVPSVVTGTGSNCVHVDGTSATCATGGGGASVDLTDFGQSVSTTSVTDDTLNIAAGRARVGNYVPPAIVAGHVQFTSGPGGNVKVFIDQNNNLVCHMATGIVATPSGSMTCSNVSTPTYPPNSIPVADVTVNSSQAITNVTDDRAFFSNRGISAATGISISDAGGVASIGIDTATMPMLGQANAWTAANDFTAATNFYIRRGSGAPASGECDAAAEVGQVYARSDAAAANATFYVCSKTGGSTYAWELLGGGGAYTKAPHVLHFPLAFRNAGGTIYPGVNIFSGTLSDATSGSDAVSYLAFADAVTNGVTLLFPIPSDWDGGTVSLKSFFFPTTGGSNGQVIRFAASAYCVGAGEDAYGLTFSSVQNIDTTLSDATESKLRIATLASLTMNGCSAGEFVHVLVERLGSDAADTLTATARMLNVELRMLVNLP
jgi:hypothetical protein